MRINFFIIHIVIFFFSALISFAQERPKVGLVLSGGSAHGLAHIGVLKYLEEKNIPIDYITGTSMGSIVGGLYAMGLPADEIEKIANEQNWSELLSTDVPLEDIAPSEKLYHNRYMITVELGKNGIRLPQGFFNSQNLDLTLNRMFRAAYKVPHFDSLPYPFRCMSVNIENGDIVQLENGFLGHAIRASMAIPSVFTPVDFNGELLVDGGLIRNFPVEEIQRMGADIVIGVYVGSKLEKREKLNTLVDILSQSAFMMGILDSEEQKKYVDVLMEPDVKELPSFGFDLSEELIAEGYRTAVKKSHQLDSLEALFENYTFKKPVRLRQPAAVDLSDTRFPFVEEPFDELAEFKYGIRRKGPVKFDYIDKGITRVFGTKHFKNINYTFHGDGRGGRIMDVLAEPRRVNTFSVAMNYMPTSGTSVIITNESRNLISKPSVLYTTVRIAENFGAKLDYYNRLGRNRDFIFHVKAQGHRYDQDILVGDITRERLKETHVLGLAGVGYEPNNVVWANAYTGIENVFLNPVEERGEDFQGYDRINLVLGAGLQLNTLDQLQFPSKGVNFQTDLLYRLVTKSELDNENPGNIDIPEDRSYLQVGAKFDVFYPLAERIVLSGYMNFGTKTSTSLSNNFRIGGFEDRDIWSISQIGLRTHQYHMSSYVQTGGFLRLQIGGPLYVSARLDYLNGDRTFLLQDFDPSQRELATIAWGGVLSVRTPLGPIHIGYGQNTDSNDWNTNVTFGYNFF